MQGLVSFRLLADKSWNMPDMPMIPEPAFITVEILHTFLLKMKKLCYCFCLRGEWLLPETFFSFQVTFARYMHLLVACLWSTRLNEVAAD
jgi:hypothetical protein